MREPPIELRHAVIGGEHARCRSEPRSEERIFRGRGGRAARRQCEPAAPARITAAVRRFG